MSVIIDDQVDTLCLMRTTWTSELVYVCVIERFAMVCGRGVKFKWVFLMVHLERRVVGLFVFELWKMVSLPSQFPLWSHSTLCGRFVTGNLPAKRSARESTIPATFLYSNVTKPRLANFIGCTCGLFPMKEASTNHEQRINCQRLSHVLVGWWHISNSRSHVPPFYKCRVSSRSF